MNNKTSKKITMMKSKNKKKNTCVQDSNDFRQTNFKLMKKLKIFLKEKLKNLFSRKKIAKVHRNFKKRL